MEVETQLLLARELEYGKPEECEAAIALAERTGALLGALMRSLGDGNDRLGRPKPPVTRHP